MVAQKILQLRKHPVNPGLIIYKIFSCVNDEYILGVMLLKPVFMFFMDEFQIFDRDFVLLLSFSNLGPFVAFFGTASQVNDFSFGNICHRFEISVKGFEDIVFSLIHIPKIFHELREHIFIGQDAPLRYFNFVWEPLACLLEGFDSGEDGIDLESESPPSWFFIVFL